MKVQFYPDDIESDVIDVPDDISEEELSDMACEWVANNVAGFWRVMSDYDYDDYDGGWGWLDQWAKEMRQKEKK